MADQRLTGSFLWYNQEGSGGILGDDGELYFAQKTNHPGITNPEKGLRVSFLVRVRSKEKQIFIADDIQLTAEAKPKAEITSDIRRAAQEALRLKRERREGLIEPVKKPARRVAEPVTIKSEFPGRYTTGRSTLAAYMQDMASDVAQKLSEEGVENNSIYRYEPAGPPASPQQPIQLDRRVAQAFRSASNITSYYSHQVTARQALLHGKNVIISTPTASGKTEAYNPTILEELLKNPNATALYVFPLVALGLDQTERLQKLNQALPSAERLEIGIYNGTVDPETKKRTLRADNRILVTTPDSLHYIILPKPYRNWRNFYQNLRYLVIDEAHVYRGVFGANMANIIRRLLARCRREGNPKYPQVIIASATIRHPDQLAGQLTGLPSEGFEIITENGAPKPGRHFLVTRSDIHDLESICSDLLDLTITPAKGLPPRPVSMIVFLRSINEVKQTARNLRSHLTRTGRRDHAGLVEEFYSDKGDKTDVLVRLRQGEVRCVFATTALMAGIDIGSLDVAIVKHYPGLVMDARQMFGRAGRAGDGAVIFIANRTDPFDQFYFDRPDLLFQGPTEDVVANPENPILLARHLLCAAQTQGQYDQEGPLSGQWASLFGQMGRDLLDNLVESNTLSIRAGSYHLNSPESPHDTPPLDTIRAMSSETFELKDGNGQLLEKKRQDTAFRDAHREAIIWVNSHCYRVVDFDLEKREITCDLHTNHELRTRGVEEKDIEILSVDPHNPAAGPAILHQDVTIQSGEIQITTRIDQYVVYKTHPVMQCRNRACRYETPNLETRRCPKCKSPVRPKNVEEVEDTCPIPTPPELKRTLKTRAAWINIPIGLHNQFSNEFWPRWVQGDGEDPDSMAPVPDFEYALHSLEHAILKAFPEYIRCDQGEIAGVYQLDQDGYAGRLFIYDDFPGGLGLSDEYVHDLRPVLEGALDVIERCTCIDDQGCPVCLSYFGCHNFNQALSKLAGRYLLCILLGKSTREVLKDLEEYVDIQVPAGLRVGKGISTPLDHNHS
jgi:DEAD/DEAH box helicase domain-containing protein